MIPVDIWVIYWWKIDVESHRQFMLAALKHAANHFRVAIQGDLVFGWYDRSIGTQVRKGKERYWLRVVLERIHWAQGDWWIGNQAAGEIQGVAKPVVLDSLEWIHGEMKLRAELMTYVKAKVCSKTPELRQILNLSQHWWNHLRETLHKLSIHPTSRMVTEQEKVTRRFLVFYGDELDSQVVNWTTAHGNLHWGESNGSRVVFVGLGRLGKSPSRL